MRRKKGIMIIKEEGKILYEGFQGVVVILDPNTMFDNEKKALIKEVQFNEEAEGFKAWNVGEVVFENNISSCDLKERIIKNLLKNHPETIEMGLPEIAITSDLEKLLSC